LPGYYRRLGNNYAQAIKQTGVKRVINLSTIGGHLDKGNGILLGAHHVENILNELSPDVAITHIAQPSFITIYYRRFIPQKIMGLLHLISVTKLLIPGYHQQT